MSSPADKVKKIAYDGLGRALGFLHSPKTAAKQTAQDTKALPLKALTATLVTAFKVKKRLSGPPSRTFTPVPDPGPIAAVTPLIIEPTPAPVTAPIKAAASKAPAKKAAVKKAPVKKVPATKAPAKKAPARKAAPKPPEK